MWVPVAGLPPRLALSAFSGAGRFCILSSGAARWKDVPARNRRGLSDFQPQLLPSESFRDLPAWVSKGRFESRRYIISPRLAETVVQFLLKQDDCKMVLEFNPGPGILTQALLQRGATVIAVESDKTFIPHLESLGKKLGGKLHVLHCDFFKLDPRSYGVMKPIVNSKLLFQDFGIKTLPWSKGIPLKVVGIFPTKNEKKMIWKLLHDIYSCTSLYRYGRVELNLFINEMDCQKIMANPQNPNLYHALSVLWQVACEIKLLHVEPCSSFDIHTQSGQLEKPEWRESSEQQRQQNLCFIQLTPRRNLFTKNLTPVNYDVFFHMLKQCFMKRNAKLIDHLNSLSPIDAMDILKKIKQKKTTKITKMYPEDFKHLFETIECSQNYTCKWLYDDFMEEVVI
ncbi:dimethyladenosine transferase 2, mitochondrial isoform X1 [Molossus molossus]|uniref:rRNA adenine N(6)-methyltransferase n=1 Tax=Molossus molossus TaxID=27622 RepID=A0A7J8BMX8_MOLMO|nr:dimethyladenosine transferase 2, mitochondrial isoform X1 [Molossus molossus]KAF6400078.1 transcription factor B2, mitochondrial [Molossus molossus]